MTIPSNQPRARPRAVAARLTRRCAAAALSIVLLTGAAGDTPARAPLLEGLGTHSHPVTTRVPLAQRYFDQGLILAWAFDYGEAARSFRESLRLDPACAMCAWGVALALGPNINNVMSEAAEEDARRHVARALSLMPTASPREQAYIRAAAIRFDVDPATVPAPAASGRGPQPPSGDVCWTPRARRPDLDRDALDRRYADAMAALAREHPGDLDAAVLQAEALMLLSPWDYWTKAGEPREHTATILAVLERVLKRAPEHPGANHFYIHALEESPHPERALAAADRLGTLVPVAGHLVHMPAHIYMRVGRYHDASAANERANAADRRYAEQLRAQGYAPLAHVAHHDHFLWASAGMEGRGHLAATAARRLSAAASASHAHFGTGGSNDYFLALPLLTDVRFGRWEAIRAAPAPRGASSYPRGVWHFARGVAKARAGDAAGARAEAAALDRAAADPRLEGLSLKGIDTLAEFLAIARGMLEGEILLAERRFDRAVVALRAALEREDRLEDNEPPPWGVPVRPALGAALLAAGRPAEAEAVYRADLARFPENGWSLFGLAQSVARQGRAAEAASIDQRFRRTWQHADFELSAPRS
jgi:tetratricopeptide (TPR) repeat protein